MSEVQAFAKTGKSKGGKNSGSSIAGDVGRAALSSVLGPVGGLVMGQVLTFCGLESDDNAELTGRLDAISGQLDTLHKDLEHISEQLDDVIKELQNIHCQQQLDSWVSVNHSEVNVAINAINDFWRIYTQIADPAQQSDAQFNIKRLMGTAGEGAGVLDTHNGAAHYRNMLNQAVLPDGGTGALELFADCIACHDFTTVDELNDRIDELVNYYYNIALFQLKATILVLEGRMWAHYQNTDLPKDESAPMPDFFSALWTEYRQMILEQEDAFMKAFGVIINRAIAPGCLTTRSYYSESEWPTGIDAQWELNISTSPYQDWASPRSFNYQYWKYAPDNRYGHYIIQPESSFLVEIEACLSELYVDSLPTQRRIVIHQIYLSHTAVNPDYKLANSDYSKNIPVVHSDTGNVMQTPTQSYVTGPGQAILRGVYDFLSEEGSHDGAYHMQDVGVAKAGYDGVEIAYQAEADVQMSVTVNSDNHTGTLRFVPYSVFLRDKDKAALPQ